MLASEHHIIFEPWVSTALIVALLICGFYVWQGWGNLKRKLSRKKDLGDQTNSGNAEADSAPRVDGE